MRQNDSRRTGPARSRGRLAIRGGRLPLSLITLVLLNLGMWWLWWQHTTAGNAADGVPLDRQISKDVCRTKLAQIGLLEDEASTHLSHQLRHAVSSHTAFRRRLYADMAAQLPKRGLDLEHMQTQGLDVRSLFEVGHGAVHPVLRPLQPPVRAVVAPLLDPATCARLRAALQDHLLPLLSADGVWLQNEGLYHATLYHASPHQHPVPANASEVAQEVVAVAAAGATLCPLRLALERIVILPSGTVVACWQLLSGSEPSVLRRTLRDALPNSPPPSLQTVQQQEILHTTLARLLKAPATSLLPSMPQTRLGRRQPPVMLAEPSTSELLRLAAEAMSADLCGLQTTIDEIWYVEEEDLLALALNGHWQKHSVPLQCQDPESFNAKR